jgi:parallel beta-helix repeat protein
MSGCGKGLCGIDASTVLTRNTNFRNACGIKATNPSDEGSLVIQTDNITLDFAGAGMVSMRGFKTPEKGVGRAVVVRGAKNVTIKNGGIRGFKIAIYAEDAPGLRIENCDVSNNYRQHLKSTPQREDESDWLYGHENDKGEWLRYGAGIYLLRCNDATIKNCRARNGQNGICIVNSDRVTAVGNDMSFMSGWGLAMWRSNFCKVISNRFDYCVRGYSHGVYARGQDSTGILVYEQCSDNVFAYNHATHGGDGFFLYAGNETVQRTGEGGCNRNLVYMNDFSYAVANGIEATFSTGNAFAGNKLNHCEHGVWAGYSRHTQIDGNELHDCRNGVSIEHGFHNIIESNSISDCDRGIWLWWDDDGELLKSAFVKNQGGDSIDDSIDRNTFERCQIGLLADKTKNLTVIDNAFRGCSQALVLTQNLGLDLQSSWIDGGEIVNREGEAIKGMSNIFRPGTRVKGQIEAGEYHPDHEVTFESVQSRQGDAEQAWLNASCAVARDYKKPISRMGIPPLGRLPGIPEGKEYIIVDDWGPYDFKQPRVWPEKITGWSPVTAMILGPPGTEFAINPLSDPNLDITPSSGKTPARITISARPSSKSLPFGLCEFNTSVKIGDAMRELSGTLLHATWITRFYEWTKEIDPRGPDENWEKIISRLPFHEEHSPSLDYVWYSAGPSVSNEMIQGGTTPRVVRDHFAVVAITLMRLPRGKWTIRTISDDGVRVFVDDRKVIDNWTWHVPTEDKAIIEIPEQGRDRHGQVPATLIRVEYFEIDGHAQLQLFIEPAN